MKKLFGQIRMTWPLLLLFAVLAGVYTGAIMLVPALENTSFQDIGISYEWWVVFAVVVVVNCERSWGAAVKCFTFFLISQPLVYLVEVLFGSLTPELAKSYYLSIWLPMTFLTLPGGWVAYFCKRQNTLGAIVLGLGNTIQLLLGGYYLAWALRSFPRHILSAAFCFGSIILMTLSIQKERRNRLTAFLLPIFLAALVAVLAKVTGRTLFS